jgi:hypothetical protein
VQNQTQTAELDFRFPRNASFFLSLSLALVYLPHAPWRYRNFQHMLNLFFNLENFVETRGVDSNNKFVYGMKSLSD